MPRGDLALEVQQAIAVFGDYMHRKDMGVPTTSTERINLFLDPMRKKMSLEDCVADVCVDNVQEEAHADIRRLGEIYFDIEVSRSGSGKSPKTDSASPTPKTSTNPGPGSTTAATSMPKAPSRLEKRRAARLEAAGGAVIGDRTNVSTSSSVKRKTLLGQELTRYLAEGVQPDEAQFNPASFKSRR